MTGKLPDGKARLWLRWVVANALGELVGLGITALVGAAVFSVIGEGTGVFAVLALASVAVLAGTLVEGTSVGTAQWLVLRRPLPRLHWRTWAAATGAGAFLAWTLGMIPSTVLSLGAGPSGQAGPEPDPMVVYTLAFAMGLVLGPVLGLAQWLVLRRFVGRAALWMPANSLAWAFGMVTIFVGADLVFGSTSPVAVLLLVITLACAGAMVGAIHGLALVWLLGNAPRPRKAR